MEEVPLLKQLHTTYASEGAVFLGIGLDENVGRADKMVKTKAIPWPQLVDGKGFNGAIAKAYRVEGTPTLYVLDRAGRIVAKLGSAKQIEAKLQEALARP